ncbi:uncharacterized protein TNCV_5115431 [Trichonephila clavipes]|nr:uncharacterized protein TNCV_5115431 [Trichonephila clavipes]
MIGTVPFCEEEESISNSSHSEERMQILKGKPLMLEEKLKKAIYSKTRVLYYSTKKKSNCFNKIKKQEIQLFDSTENPSPNIIKVSEALKTILLTSVEAERAFSAAGFFVTKLRY